jgi:DNA-binding NarL/FixJ family response regulator
MPRENPHPSFTLYETDVPHLGTLPPSFANIVRLVHYEKMNMREIARDLGISEGTVKSRLHRARRKIELERERAERGETELDRIEAKAALQKANRIRRQERRNAHRRAVRQGQGRDGRGGQGNGQSQRASQ